MEEMWRVDEKFIFARAVVLVFFFFISNWEEPTELNDEISRLISSVERPLKPNATTRRIWGLEFKWPDDRLEYRQNR